MELPLGYYITSGILNFFTSLFLAVLIFSKAHWIKTNRLFAYFCLSITYWSFFYAIWLVQTDQIYADFYLRTCMAGVILMPAIYYHFIVCLLNKKNRQHLIYINYALSVFFLFFQYTPLYGHDSSPIFTIRYWLKPGLIFHLVISHFCVIFSYSFYTLWREVRKSEGLRKTQMIYVWVGILIGIISGSTNYFSWYRIPIPPFLNAFVSLYLILQAYAIIRYRLMDIRLAVTRASIFLVVYTLVLGIPFGIGFYIIGMGKWLLPVSVMAVFATVGPFLYLFLQRKTEDRILQEERRIQDSLVQASRGMNAIHSLQKLLKLVIVVTTKTLRINTAKIYLLDRESGQYVLRMSLESAKDEDGIIFGADNPLVQLLVKRNYPVVFDELKMLSNMEINNSSHHNVAVQMKELLCDIVVPITISNSLLGFLALGERQSKQNYSKELLNTLSVLGNQTALAIENCHYIDAETKRLETEGLKERMTALDHMASSMAHEIDNPMHIIRQSLGFMKEFLLKDPRASIPKELKEAFEEAIERSQGAAERVSGMIKAVLDYSRMGKGTLEPVSIPDAVQGFMPLMHPQIKTEKVLLETDIEDDLPLVLGDKVQMEEIFMNFVRNALHAVKRNTEKKILLKAFKKNENTIRVECSDNGYGIPKGIINDIFLSSTTTKGSSEGTGLGLFRVRKIIDLFGGKVWAESEGKDKGSTFIVELPVYQENLGGILNNNHSE